MRTPYPGGERYFILLTNNCTRITWVGLLKEKSKYFDKFRILKEMVENEMEMKIKFLILDRGGEFISNEFNDFSEKQEIK